MQLLVLSGSLYLLAGCDGPHEKAGKQADQAAGIKAGVLSEGPQQKLGALQDRTDRDRANATEATADALEDRAKAIRSAGDQQADALDAQAHAIRKSAK
jgi:hypothetical protein